MVRHDPARYWRAGGPRDRGRERRIAIAQAGAPWIAIVIAQNSVLRVPLPA
jgi:hypothetical protein